MRTIRIAMALAVFTVAALASSAPARAAAEISHHTVDSSADGTVIAFTVFKPAAASAQNQVPVILHSHGWAGARATSGFESWTDDATDPMGVVSIDQRGHGESGGEANVQDPELEAQDIKTVIDFIAALDWVRLDGPGDPVMGAIGGSYGGGYQTITALTEVMESGTTRFNALAPEITWNHLPRSLAPNGVPRTLWTTLLYAVGAPMVPMFIHEGFVVGTATATFPDGSVPGTVDLEQIFYEHSPDWFADNGYQLDIPVLFRQGISDNLFPLNEAWHNYEEVLTDAARARSIVIGYNGGHVLPSVMPQGVATGGDACSSGGVAGRNFGHLTRDFFEAAFSGGDTASLMPAPYNLTAADGTTCVHVSSLNGSTSYELGSLVAPAAYAGLPLATEVASGPLTVAGIPVLRGDLTIAGADARAFVALSVGTSITDAKIIQNNVVPIRSLTPKTGEALTLELPGVAIEVGTGEKLFLTIAPVTDMFVGMGSKAPGLFMIDNAVLDVPVVS